MSDSVDRIRSQSRDAVGAAGAAKYGYQAGRVVSGLGTTTRLTVALDLASAGTTLQATDGLTDLARAGNSGAKGAVGAARLSGAARLASVASSVAPVVARGSAVLGGVLGGIEIGRGVHALSQGDSQEATDRFVSGGADVVTAGALLLAAGSGGTVVGLPVAAVALGVAGLAQGVKYAYRYREQIGGAIQSGADLAGQGVRAVGQGVSQGASWVGDRAGDVGGGVARGASWVGDRAGDVGRVLSGGARLIRGFLD